MDETHEPAADHDGERPAEARRRDIEVRVRRAPKYGTFMAIGAVVGAVAMWLIGMLMPPGEDPSGGIVDTTPVIGLGVVVGFVVGAGLGGLVAVIVDRALLKRGATLVAEQLDVEVPESPVEAEPFDEDADAVEAAFEPLGQQPAAQEPAASSESATPQDPTAQQERDRRSEA